MIEEKGGRARSARTSSEIEELLRKEMNNLTPEERSALEVLLDELKQGQTKGGLYEALHKTEYKVQPVSMEQFVKDEYYLGKTCDTLYPKLLEDLTELFSGGYNESIWTGCIDLNAIVQSSNGSLKTIREWVGTRGSVLGFDPSGSRVARTGKAKHSGVQPTLRMVLANGMEERLTPNHEVVVWRDEYRWLPASEVETDDFVVVPRRVRITPDSNLSEAEAKLLAYWCTDGSSSEQRSRFNDGNPATSLEVIELLKVLGFSGKRTQIDNYWEVYVEEHKRSGFLTWLRQHDGHHKTKDVLVPDVVCRAPDAVVAAFLNRVWAAEGCVYVNPVVSPPRFTLGMTSERFIRQVQMLLLRFGIQSRIVFTPQFDKRSGKTTETWFLSVSGCGPMKQFLAAIGPILGKEEKCAELADYVSLRRANTNVDVLPIERRWLSKRMTEEGLTRAAKSRWWELARGTGKYLSRQMFDEWKSEFGSSALGQRLSQQFPDDFGFERVKEISDGGEIEVGDVCDVEGVHSFISNGIYSHNSIGYGKTFAASIGVCRVLYEISCLQDPFTTFGLAKDSNISIVCLSVNEALAVKVAFENIATKIKASAYFQEHFAFTPTKKELRFPNNIWVAARATTDTSALGLNAVGCIMDETNFMPTKGKVAERMGYLDHAEVIYNSIQRRMKSRLLKKGRMPGMLFIVSSKKTNDDFTARRIRASRDDSSVFVRDYALWDVKRENYSNETFCVIVGSDQTPSRILEPMEVAPVKAKPPENCLLLDVPEDFRPDFESDLEGAIRDLAGCATVAISPFIHRREKILEAVQQDIVRYGPNRHPFSVPTYDPSKGGTFIWEKMIKDVEERQLMGPVATLRRPIINPSAPRHIHIDPALRNDALGFCMAHIAEWKDVVRRSERGQYLERAPVYVVDLILQVTPPAGDEIILGDIRRLIYELHAHGYMITNVSLDSFQSRDTLQQLQQKGFNAEMVSVDTSMEPYETLKTALYENRLFVYEYPALIKELQQLEKDALRRKVDHPPKGSKDCADALAGVCYTLLRDRTHQPLPILRGISVYGDAWMPEQKQARMAGDAAAERNTDLQDYGMLPPFLAGGGRGDGDF